MKKEEIELLSEMSNETAKAYIRYQYFDSIIAALILISTIIAVAVVIVILTKQED